MTDDLSGQTLKGYAIGERIGTGSFGAVYRATQISIEREVAIKVILPSYANHPDFIRRFETEAQLSPAWNTRISSRCSTTGANRTARTS